MTGDADFATIVVGALIDGLLPSGGQGGAIVGLGCDRLEPDSDVANAFGCGIAVLL